jgi:hypothetical protein
MQIQLERPASFWYSMIPIDWSVDIGEFQAGRTYLAQGGLDWPEFGLRGNGGQRQMGQPSPLQPAATLRLHGACHRPPALP